MSSSVSTTLFSKQGTILAGVNLDCRAAITGDFNNDIILEFTVYNDSATDIPIRISTESVIDINAFQLDQGENIKIEMNPEKLYLINSNGAVVTYRLLFKLRIVSD